MFVNFFVEANRADKGVDFYQHPGLLHQWVLSPKIKTHRPRDGFWHGLSFGHWSHWIRSRRNVRWSVIQKGPVINILHNSCRNLKIWSAIYETKVKAWPQKRCDGFRSQSWVSFWTWAWPGLDPLMSRFSLDR